MRDRAWVLPRFINHVTRMDLTDIQLETLFIANDCTDDSVQLLSDAGFAVEVYNDLPTRTESSVRGHYSYSHLATLRNLLIDHFLKTDNDYLFSVDTDVLVPPDGLCRLLNHRRDVCSMLLCNQAGPRGQRAHNIMRLDPITRWYRHILKWPAGSLIQVDVTGAVYLIHRSVLERGVRYAAASGGEDYFFCHSAQKAGCSLWCDTALTPVHVMGSGIELVGG
ncbi:MAG TPA: glycosyltransferase [Symbiobacteriaceae bacterium]